MENLEAFIFRYGSGLPVLGEFESNSNLSNGGERILLLDNEGTTIRDFEYDDDSLARIGRRRRLCFSFEKPQSNPDHKLAESWQSSPLIGGEPGQEGKGVTFADWQLSNFSTSN